MKNSSLPSVPLSLSVEALIEEEEEFEFPPPTDDGIERFKSGKNT